jgi:hypothetical protein
MKRRLLGITVAAIAVVALTGCAPEDGTVTQSYRNSDGKNWTICASKDGKEGCSTLLSVSDGPRCQVGEAYPDCLSTQKEVGRG